MKLKLITFDATNTLIHFKVLPALQYALTAKQYGVKIDPDKDSKKITQSFKKFWIQKTKVDPCFGALTGRNSQQWWQDLMQSTFNDAGFCEKQISSHKLESICVHLFDLYASEKSWRVDDQAPKLLNEIQAKYPQINLGIISNFDDRLINILQGLEIGHYFTFILHSRGVSCAKPDSKIFQMALDKVECKESSEALHVGDNIELDYIAARDAGWNSLLLSTDPIKHDPKVNPRHVIHSINEVLNHIDGHN